MSGLLDGYIASRVVPAAPVAQPVQTLQMTEPNILDDIARQIDEGDEDSPTLEEREAEFQEQLDELGEGDETDFEDDEDETE